MDQEEKLEVTPEAEAKEESFDLESIIAEFREEPAVPAEEPAPELPEEEPAAEEPLPEEPANPLVQETVRVDLSQLPKQEEPEPAPQEPEQPSAPVQDSPTEQWEPEYEQALGDFSHAPIPYHPQSRLKELKKKLVAGPEHRYYKLMEIGTGKLQAAIFIAIVIMLLCAGSTVLYHFGLVQPDRIKLMIFGQILAMFLSALVGSHQLVEGLADLFRGRFSLNTLLIFSFLLCTADGVICLQDLRVPCCASFTLQVVLSLFDTLHTRRVEIGQMDILRKATNLTAVRPVSEMLDGKKVLLRDEGEVEDFMDVYARRSVPEKIRSWYAVFALLAAIGVGVTAYMLHGVAAGLQVAAVTLLAAMPASFFICLSRPADILQRKLYKLNTVICGWKGTAAVKGEHIFPVEHSDLFPAGAVKMNGVKFFGSREPDEVVAYGAALILSDKNGLAPLFDQVLQSRNCLHLSAQNLEFYEGGITGEVRGESVMVGSLSFLEDMGVEIPEGMRVSQAVCVAVDGVLSGLFAISYEKTRIASGGLHALCYYRKIKPLIYDGDFLLTGDFLKARFGIKPKRIRFADHPLRTELSELTPNREVPAAVLSTQPELISLAYGISGAKALRTASFLGLAVHMAGGLIGIGIMLTLTLLGATDLLTPLNVVLYQLVWSLPGILLTEWTRLL